MKKIRILKFNYFREENPIKKMHVQTGASDAYSGRA